MACNRQTGDADISSDNEELAQIAGRLFNWAHALRAAKTVGEVLRLNPELRLPLSESALWNRLALLPLPGMEFPDLAEQVSNLLSGIDPANLRIYFRRAFFSKSESLAAVGTDVGRTRETVRQIQSRVDELLRQNLRRPEFDLLRWHATEITDQLGTHFPLGAIGRVPGVVAIGDAFRLVPHVSTNSEISDVVSSLLDCSSDFALTVAGHFSVRDGWISSGRTALEDSVAPLLELLEKQKFITHARALRVLRSKGFNELAAEHFLSSCPRVHLREGIAYWWHGDVAAKSAVILQRLGRPAGAHELLSLLGGDRSIRTLRNALYKHPDIVRVAKSEFALKEWGGARVRRHLG